MTKQPELILENNLVDQLVGLGYSPVSIKDEGDLVLNLKSQLEKHNKTKFNDNEFKQILNYISKGNIFERSKTLRDRVPYINDKNETKTIELINQQFWCQNEFQVTNQITIKGQYENRYDVTILVNGLPLVQIELKRRGLELKEAFNQTNRYERHSYGSGHGLFQFIQLFVISNGVNTKYFANNPIKERSFKQTFYWSDENNKLITQLSKFTDIFLEPCHLSKMITKYIVLNETHRVLMVLRPYQYYATENIVERVKSTDKFGYIWHTTGSGKTLTSFKTAQILTQLPNVHKVVFVVDRKDLDYQTTKEFNSFSKGSIDGTNNTNTLANQLAGDTKLIITTIQKLNTAITKNRYQSRVEGLADKKVVFIFDECHRSQFGKTHEEIRKFFPSSQMFGFTGTPIFEENAGSNEFGKRTTTMLFDKCLHKYVITDAIRDDNVLKFSVEYISTFKKKESIVDINVEDIDETEVMNSPARLEGVVDYIINNHDRKTHNRKFTSIFCVSSVSVLVEYYKIFREKQKDLDNDKKLKIATIFSYQSNEEDKDTLGNFGEEFSTAAEPESEYVTQHSRDYLEDFIGDYNKTFGTNYTTKDSQSYYNYYNDIARKVKEKQIDVLLVVNMFLTGFDSKLLNTLYVDKNLKFHGLIQAYSRTNRIFGELKSQGNIVSFRNLKKQTDDAIRLFSNLDNKDLIVMEPYEVYLERFNDAYNNLTKLTPSVDSVNDLISEDDQFEFIKLFRDLMRVKNVLNTFTQFEMEETEMEGQEFEDYKSKYLDLYDRHKGDSKEKVSIINDIDFELELIHRDEINVSYILNLLSTLKNSPIEEQETQKKKIIEIITGQSDLRSKRELIERFIDDNLPNIEDSDNIPEEFEKFWNKERVKYINKLVEEENLDKDKLEKVIGDYMFTEKEPLRDDLIDMLHKRPSLKERSSTSKRLKNRIVDFVETYNTGVGV
ncbi:type I restriction enzyme, R subunit [Tenacibaculum sp. MAR_2010_89]|uniref:type I restriction endonuclease subunit R n=1 Tax=Tenacibaculum sp. MAR_2010_89 TaxID=1250198 RepID=UPI00089B4446|nr:type I restriction endonuclease subunit R [Tenacibaculum sp. MAR_2010_89]SED60329.1 type I restriction enzyme, R subunit [Tenacibaculum sp. MAR_2010_89]